VEQLEGELLEMQERADSQQSELKETRSRLDQLQGQLKQLQVSGGLVG
jgi:peptidoglycan hydrolase CwlO-like protein